MRDLRKDALAQAQLVTLPVEMLSGYGLSRDGLAGAFDDPKRKDAVIALIGALDGKAWQYRIDMKAAVKDLQPLLGRRERSILKSLLAIYTGLHDRITANPAAVLDESVCDTQMRAQLEIAEAGEELT